MNTLRPRGIALVALLVLSACAGEGAYRQGLELTEGGQFEQGLEKLEQAVKANPQNPQFRVALVNRRMKAINEILGAADVNLGAGELAAAEDLYNRVLGLDKDNARAKSGLRRVTQAQQHAGLVVGAMEDFNAGRTEAASDKIQVVLLENPKHEGALALRNKLDERKASNKFSPPSLVRYKNPVTLEFRDAPVKMVFDVLSSTAGVNFILDKDLRPEQRVSIFVKQVTFDSALNMLLDANQLDKKILNENTVVIYPRTPQKSQEYEELLVKTYYLANADPKQTANMIRTILKVRDVFVDDRLNMLILRDKPETIRMVDRLIEAQDLPESEVLLDVSVVEIQRGRLVELGIQPPTAFGVLNTNAPGDLTLDVLAKLNPGGQFNRAGVSVSGTPGININQDSSKANILANPRIRVRNREKAKIHVGNKVPVVTTNTASSGGSTSETVTYIDTGIKLEVKPSIYLDGDVAIDITLEVSSQGKSTTLNNGSLVYEIGTRNSTTSLRLKDGETQLLAGLINDEDRKSINGLPGLSDLPLIGRLFASHKDEQSKTEIVLSITPHVVRNIERPDVGAVQFWSGTETGGKGSYQNQPFIPRGMRDDLPPIVQPPPPPPLPVPPPPVERNPFPPFQNPVPGDPSAEEPPPEEPPAEEPPPEEPPPEEPPPEEPPAEEPQLSPEPQAFDPMREGSPLRQGL